MWNVKNVSFVVEASAVSMAAANTKPTTAPRSTSLFMEVSPSVPSWGV